MDKLTHLRLHLSGKVIILGIGNRLQRDDGLGSILASRIKDKLPYTVYDAGASPENYLGKIIKEKPDNIILIDAVDFGGDPGDFELFEGGEVKTLNFFSTHDASLSLTINYLQDNLAVDIIILAVQPKRVIFGEGLSPQVTRSLDELEKYFYEASQKKG